MRHHAIAIAVVLTFAASSCVPDRDCGIGQVPNELLQACVTLPPCDGGTVNERNECAWPADAGAAVDVAGDGGSFPRRVESGQTQGGTTGEAGVAGPAGDASVEQDADAGAERDAASGAAGSVAMTNAPVCGDGKRDGNELCDGDCPTECPDNDNGCIRPRLEGSPATCDARCATTEISECLAADGCCPMGCDFGSDTDCSPSCGDGELTPPEKCEPGSTEYPCPSVRDCDDRDSCTADRVIGSECSAACANTPITQPTNGDRCCPPGANSTTDDDCEAECGNGIREDMELCDGDCPTSCDDGNACTEDELVGSAAGCNARCRHGSGSANACGGCGSLTNAPGSDCMVTLNSCVSSGVYECAGTEAVRCNARIPAGAAERCDGDDDDCDGRIDEGVKNTCGGCTSLQAAVGGACFVEGVGCTNQGRYQCEGTDALRCDAMPCLCGNGVVDSGESCDVMVPGGNSGSCPVSCNDNDPCTTDRKVGSLCQTSCLFVPMGGTCTPQEPEPELPFSGDFVD